MSERGHAVMDTLLVLAILAFTSWALWELPWQQMVLGTLGMTWLFEERLARLRRERERRSRI